MLKFFVKIDIEIIGGKFLMTGSEQREAARQFINRWRGKGKEDEDGRSYWIELLSNVFGVENVTERIDFEKKVVVDGNTKRIDVYIPETRVIIEQKSLNIPLDKKIRNSGDIDLTPFEQADRYNSKLIFDERARWIVTCNFSEIWIYDMNEKQPEPTKIMLEELQTKYPLLDFLIEKEIQKISHETEVSIKAGDIVGLLYNAFLKQYKIPEEKKNETAVEKEKREHKLKSLNALCVRLVFCLYAEDAGIFGEKRNMFHDYLARYEARDCRRALIELFKVLDTEDDDREDYLEEDLAQFPYVNGGLFADETIEIPQFTEEIRELLLVKASEEFNWRDISPTIFGAVFESTLNPKIRRSGGMHYTSIENIHKVIDPLFLDDLDEEFETIQAYKTLNVKRKRLMDFQEKLAHLKFLDPACGSGNFLTETYLSLRRLENKVLRVLYGEGQGVLGIAASDIIKVSIQQFYGIEINDFAVTVAKTALWIAESQMLDETKNIIYGLNADFLPLKTYVNITEGNALRVDWNDVVPANELNYIMGNPPFVGQAIRSTEQSEDMVEIFGKGNSETKLDYVICWYRKALTIMKINEKIISAFVSTNSICQGESVPTFWKNMISEGVEIQFAYTSFPWTSESNSTAGVYCVIVGFSAVKIDCMKRLYFRDNVQYVKYINAYLIAAPDIWIMSRTNNRPKGFPKIEKGSEPTDGGELFLKPEQAEILISKYPELKKYVRKFIGGNEVVSNKCGEYSRYCLWFENANPSDYVKNQDIIKRLKRISALRMNSSASRIRKKANEPYLFCQIRQPQNDYIIIPRHSTSSRRYIPIAYEKKEVICGDSAYIIASDSLFLFGVLNSNVHNAWMRVICGRLGMAYRYSPSIYNNFPWPNPTENQKNKVEKTAQSILDARALYPNSSLADLYNPLTMPAELLNSHAANNKAVMEAYGFSLKMSEEDCVAELMKLYQKMILEEKMKKSDKKSKKK